MKHKYSEDEVFQVSTKKQLENRVIGEFKLQYGNDPCNVTLTPGRINIIGEHTDYNSGLAMPAAIDRWICVAISQSNNKSSTIYSLNYKKCITIFPKSTDKIQYSWIQLATTAIHILTTEFGLKEGGNVVVGGNIPIGGGLSSSTAFVIAITYTFCQLFSIQIRDRKLAYLCQKIEHIALGTACGLLDQYSIILSKKNNFMVIDFHDDTIEYIPIYLNEYSWIVVNSQIQRELFDSAYIQRVNECKDGLEILKEKFNIDGFRNIDIDMLLELKSNHEILYKRLLHLVDENDRVKDMIDQLEQGATNKIGTILKKSHESLRLLYQVSCKEIDFIIERSDNFDGWHGGRMIGGGFGGCSIHLLSNHVVDDYHRYLTTNYKKKYNIDPDILKVTFSGGLQNINPIQL